MQNVSLAIFLFGLVYVFGTYVLGRVLAAMDHGHDIDKGLDKDFDKSFEKDFDKDFDHGEVDSDYDMEHEIDSDHDFEHDYDHDIGEPEGELESGLDGVMDEFIISDGGYFEVSAGIPISITIGTTLISFGFIGMVLYSNEILFEYLMKVGIHLGLTIGMLIFIRLIIGRLFKETGFNINYGDMIGHRVLAMSTVSREFGEVRGRTEMGLRRFHARPAKASTIYQKGLELYVVAADKKLLYVHHEPNIENEELEKLMGDYTIVDGKKTFFRKKIVSECGYCNHLNESQSLICGNCGGPLERLVAMKFFKEEVSDFTRA